MVLGVAAKPVIVPAGGRQIMSLRVSHRITGHPMNTGSQHVSTR
jgi:hypothetical protein